MVALTVEFTLFLVVGLIFHLFVIGSIFDCYFMSPVVSSTNTFHLPEAESKRVVLIIADGLRADLLFSLNAIPGVSAVEDTKTGYPAPYLRSIAETRGIFGVSHTRVPTESRPGHVALIAGMYEYTSSLLIGWKTNPLDFDTVFKRSRQTFAFGSPDILPIFSAPRKVSMWTYNTEDEDFTKDATVLDTWVLNRLRTLFKNATTDAALDVRLRQDKTIFFLHLLGLDITGHFHRPESKEYMRNIGIVDDLVHQTEALFEQFYGDDETSFIFTSDHGMTAIGNHGDGGSGYLVPEASKVLMHRARTEVESSHTPLIAWGKGIQPPRPDSSPSSHDSYSQPWQLGNLQRRDIEQAGIAVLIAALLGIEWPVNGVGILPGVDPSHPGYLLPKKGDRGYAEAGLVNAKVLLEQYRVLHELRRTTTAFYNPFPDLEAPSATGQSTRFTKLSRIESSIENHLWSDARKQSVELIQTALTGLRYLQTYDSFMIQTMITMGYLGWSLYAFSFIYRADQRQSQSLVNSVVTSTSILTLMGFWIFFALQSSPGSYYLYIVLPCYFWRQLVYHSRPPFRIRTLRRDFNRLHASYPKAIAQGTIIFAALLSMVVAYTNRIMWSVGCVILGIVWPILSWPRMAYGQNRSLLTIWTISCFIMGVFPLLPVIRDESLFAILAGGLLMLVTGIFCVVFVAHHARRKLSWLLITFFIIQLVLVVCSMVVTASSVISLRNQNGLPLLNKVVARTVLVSATLSPFFMPVRRPTAFSKLVAVYLGFCPCFVIMCVSWEGLFYVAFSTVLLLWIEVESVVRVSAVKTGGEASEGIVGDVFDSNTDNLRIALFVIFFIQIVFFGSGNFASISSFFLHPIWRLEPIFNPRLAAVLLIFKIVAPYAMLSASLAVLNSRLRLPPYSLFMTALGVADVMTLTFFLRVSDQGSWRDIGQSISSFVIASLLFASSSVICAAGEKFMEGSIPRILEHRSEKSD